jgi:hypothetical protein
MAKRKHDGRIEGISAALEGLRDEAIAELDAQIRCARDAAKKALEFHAAGDGTQARAFLKKALDAEYDAFADCEVLGPIAQELFPDEDTVDWPDVETPPVAGASKSTP